MTNVECGLVTGETASADRERILRRFKGESFPKDLIGGETGPLKYLANVNVLTTGFDAPNIDCVVLLRPTASPGLYYQMCLDMDTEVLTPTGWRRCHEITIDDTVAAFDTATEEIVYVHAEDKIHRALHRDESMYGILSPRLDIRVTNNHNMVVRNKGATCKYWKIQPAEQIARRSDGYHLPVAGRGERFSREVDLSDAEVAFLGWFLTDGYKNHSNGTIHLTQSVVKFHEELRKTLTECGFGFKECRQERTGDLAKYEDNISFVIPYGTPRGKQAGKKGWSYLEEWIDKDLPAIYGSLSKRQFRILIDAMSKANGRHHDRLKLNYTPRTMTISLGCRRRLADRIQQLAIERGFRCDVRSFRQEPSDWNRFPQEQWCVALREKTMAFVGGMRKDENELIPNRCRFDRVPYTQNEWVWCLATEKGTLVTRRNGKVAILGNCGRGFRLHESKTDCLVLDYGGNILRHGPVDAIQLVEKQKGTGDAPAKECPQCMAIVHAAVRKCPDCGFEFPLPEKEKHDAQASNEGVLSGEITDTEWDVETASYHVHVKRGAMESDPRTLRVDYRVGFNQYQTEWVCPEHSGWARKKFEKWWTDRSNDPPPADADQAARMANAGSLSAPVNIVVRKVGGEKFDRIIKCTLPNEKPPAVGDLAETDMSLCERCLNSGYDDGFELICKAGWKPGGDCSHFESVAETNVDIDDVPF